MAPVPAIAGKPCMTKKANGARPLTPPVRRTDVSLAISVALDDNHSSHLRRCRPWSRDITVTPLVFSSEVVLPQLHGRGRSASGAATSPLKLLVSARRFFILSLLA